MADGAGGGAQEPETFPVGVEINMFRVFGGAVAVFLVTGCATPEQKEAPLTGTVSLSAGPCLGLCPVYTMTVGTDDRYELVAGPNTIKEGRSTGGLPVGAFRRALDILDIYDFRALRRGYVSNIPEGCPDSVSGTPTLTVERDSGSDRKTVTYEVGCLGFPEKDSLDQMINDLYRNFRINDLVAVGEPPKAEDNNQATF